MDYDDITLKLFMHIVETGEYDKLMLPGTKATPDECYEQWEVIIRANNKANGSIEFSAYIDHVTAYNSLLRTYNSVKASLIKLCFVVDNNDIQYLMANGYKIDDTDRETYTNSLTAAFKRSDNLITRIRMKGKQIEALGSKTVNDKNPTFNSLIAGLIHAGYNVNEDIKLAVYTELKRLVDKQNENGRPVR